MKEILYKKSKRAISKRKISFILNILSHKNKKRNKFFKIYWQIFKRLYNEIMETYVRHIK